ncbi:hypothetical protein ACSVIJ_05450 [Pseudomonas sp. NCHU5208]|uniref:hypothetical protein n=1 Tax=unclassified Pseudomonas TaxID=196821 RepID=UPI003F9BB0D7
MAIDPISSLQIRRKVASLWRIKARAATSPLTILSPFITGELCTSLVEGKANARIYTRFDVPLFASGGSSLDQLEALLRAGHQLFKIDGLHAKVVMDESSFVTIGSQNLTKRGRLHNKELSAAFTSDKVRDVVRARIAPWLEEAEPITAEMIQWMRDNVKDPAALHKAFREACETVELSFAAQFKRQADVLPLTEDADGSAVKVERERRLQAIRGKISERMTPLKKSFPAQRCRVIQPKKKNHSPFLSVGSGSFTNWQIEQKTIELDQGKRYLCALESGDIGWVRVASGRITKISRGFASADGILPIDRSLSLELSGDLTDLRRLPPGANLAAIVWRGETRICTLPVMFDLKECEVQDPIHPNGRPLRLRPGEKRTDEVVAWLSSQKEETRRIILREILGPFDFRERLLGENADSFFGAPGSYCFASVAEVERKPVLLVTFPLGHKRKRQRHTPTKSA